MYSFIPNMHHSTYINILNTFVRTTIILNCQKLKVHLCPQLCFKWQCITELYINYTTLTNSMQLVKIRIDSSLNNFRVSLINDWIKIIKKTNILAYWTRWEIYARSPRILRANWISLGIMVTRLAWMAHKFVSSNRPTRYASLASCNIKRNH